MQQRWTQTCAAGGVHTICIGRAAPLHGSWLSYRYAKDRRRQRTPALACGREKVMTHGLTAVSTVPGADSAAHRRRAIARLSPGGRHRPGDRPARRPPAGDPASWQDIIDLLDPGRRCGAWCPGIPAGRPVVCTRAPHDALEQHLDAQTGWRWYGEGSWL
jgi:hypothetical protein